MGPQEMFDLVARHLLTQDERSGTLGGSCFYRTDYPRPGLMCAIGCLIPPAKYDPAMEGRTVAHHSVMQAAGVTHETIELASDLQDIHDQHEVGNWPLELRRVANLHNLSATVVEENA